MAGTLGLALAGSATIALAVGFAASRASAQTAGTAHHHDAAPSAKAGSHKHSDNEAAADPSFQRCSGTTLTERTERVAG